MTLATLMKKGGLREVATAIPATAATDNEEKIPTVARVAALAVAKPQSSETGVIGKLPLRAWVIEEIRDGDTQRAVKICSELLEDHLWLVIDRSYQPIDALVIYYPEELPELRTKTSEQLREIHKVKLAFPGCRVIQEGAEK